MSSMYTVPVPPAVGLVRLPTPITIESTAVIFTPAEVNSLRGIVHCCQAVATVAAASGCATVLDLLALSLIVI